MGALSGVGGLGDDVPSLRVSLGTPISCGITAFSSFYTYIHYFTFRKILKTTMVQEKVKITEK